MDSSEKVAEEFCLCLMTLIVYLQIKFKEHLIEYQTFLRGEINFPAYKTLIKKINDQILCLPTIFDKIRIHAKGKDITKYSMRLVITSLTELCSNSYTDIEKIERIKELIADKKLNKSFIKPNISIDEKIDNYNLIKMKSYSRESLLVLVSKKETLLKALIRLKSSFSISEIFIKASLDLFVYAFYEKCNRPDRQHNEHLKILKENSEIFCHKIGILPYGLIRLQQQDFDNSFGDRESVENSNEEDMNTLLSESIWLKYGIRFKEKSYIDCGAYGTVMKVNRRLRSCKFTKDYAIKMIIFNNKTEEYVMEEVKRMQILKNKPYFVKLYDYWTEKYSLINKSEIETYTSQDYVIYDGDSDNDGPVEKKVLFILMEYCNKNLKQYFDNRQSVIINQSLAIAYQLLKGLQQLHNANIIHGDLYARNIFIKRHHGLLKVKIGDFGLTSSMKEVETKSNKSFNTDLRDLAPILLRLFHHTTTDSEFSQTVSCLSNGVLPDTLCSGNRDRRLRKIGAIILRLASLESGPQTECLQIKELLKDFPKFKYGVDRKFININKRQVCLNKTMHFH